MKTIWIAMVMTLNVISYGQFKQVQTLISTLKGDSRSINFIDVNDDGFDDIFISNGKEGGQKDLLFYNDQNGDFKLAPPMDLTTISKPSDGASFADYNGDGYMDAVVSNWYGFKDDLLLNDGNGKLQTNTQSGFIDGSYAETAFFGDYNNDQLLDIYVTVSGGNKLNLLYKNIGGGKFERVVNHTLVQGSKPSRGAIWSDFNNDGNSDLFVVNEEANQNALFLGSGGDTYIRVSTGIIVTDKSSSITVSTADVDNDGDMDIYVGNSQFLIPSKGQLFINNGDATFSLDLNKEINKSSQCNFGSTFLDYDNDGDLDLYLSTGFCNVDNTDKLFINDGNGNFTLDNSKIPSLDISTYGCASGDFNNDGFQDIMIASCTNVSNDVDKASILLVNAPNQNNWVQIKLMGVESNINAIGARIKIRAMINGKPTWQIREISGQTGYAGQNSLVAHFGLNNATVVDSVVVFWPNGSKQYALNLAVNQRHMITYQTSSTELTNSINELEMMVNPNPISTFDSFEITLETEISFNGILEVRNTQGLVIQSQIVKTLSGKNRFSMLALMKSGTYFATCSDGVSTKAIKFIVVD